MQKNHLRLTCPHCEAFARVRKSVGITPTLREALVECTNTDCNWRGQMTLAMEYTLTPSDISDSHVRLPLSPRLRKQLERELSTAIATAGEAK